MKKFICLSLLVMILTLSFSSCEEKPIRNNDTENFAITMNDVQYAKNTNFISDSNYIISTGILEDYTGITKYNIKTGNISSVCLQQNCRHGSVIFSHHTDHCQIPLSSPMYFIVEGKIYYSYEIKTVDFKELELEGSTSPITTKVFAYYDITTGDFKDLGAVIESSFEDMYGYTYHDGYIYYARYIAKTANPSSAEDYNYAICRMDTKKYNQEVLFTDEDVPALTEKGTACPLAIKDNIIYFSNFMNGRVFAVNLDGTGFKYLIDGKDDITCYSIPFYHDNYLYFTVYTSSDMGMRDVLRLYRVNCETGDKQLLTEDYASWLFVTDQGIYYGMSKTQLTEAQSEQAYTDNPDIHTLKFMAHDGSNSSVLGHLDIPDSEIDDVCAIGDSLYFNIAWWMFFDKIDEEGNPYTVTRRPSYMIRYNVVDNTVTEIEKPEKPEDIE